jgi:hypothetical protein
MPKGRQQYTWQTLNDLRVASMGVQAFIGNLESVGLDPTQAPDGALTRVEAQLGWDQAATSYAKGAKAGGAGNDQTPYPAAQLATLKAWMKCYEGQGAVPHNIDIGAQAAVVVPGGGVGGTGGSFGGTGGFGGKFN